ncbi:MAG: hypothetical protein ACRYG8_01250 [Janthinobacterium lividum]
MQIVLAELAAAADYAEAARAVSTRRPYAQDWRVFVAWCAVRALELLPADPRAVAVFLASEASRGCAPMTIGRRLAAIGHAHRQHGLQPPQGREGAAAIVEIMAGIRRSHGKPPARKSAADADVMRDILGRAAAAAGMTDCAIAEPLPGFAAHHRRRVKARRRDDRLVRRLPG